MVQIIWAKTTHIGCGATKFGPLVFRQVIIVCNYGPEGSYSNQPIYVAGKIGSACGKLKQNGSGLCGFPRKLDDDRWQPPFRKFN